MTKEIFVLFQKSPRYYARFSNWNFKES